MSDRKKFWKTNLLQNCDSAQSVCKICNSRKPEGTKWTVSLGCIYEPCSTVGITFIVKLRRWGKVKSWKRTSNVCRPEDLRSFIEPIWKRQCQKNVFLKNVQNPPNHYIFLCIWISLSMNLKLQIPEASMNRKTTAQIKQKYRQLTIPSLDDFHTDTQMMSRFICWLVTKWKATSKKCYKTTKTINPYNISVLHIELYDVWKTQYELGSKLFPYYWNNLFWCLNYRFESAFRCLQKSDFQNFHCLFFNRSEKRNGHDWDDAIFQDFLNYKREIQLTEKTECQKTVPC